MITIAVLYICLRKDTNPDGLLAVMIVDIIIAVVWAKAFVAVFGG